MKIDPAGGVESIGSISTIIPSLGTSPAGHWTVPIRSEEVSEPPVTDPVAAAEYAVSPVGGASGSDGVAFQIVVCQTRVTGAYTPSLMVAVTVYRPPAVAENGIVSVVCPLAPDRPTEASPACWSTTLVQVTARSAVIVIVGPIAEIVLPSAGDADSRCGGRVWAGEIVQP